MSFYKNRREDTCAFVCDECGIEHSVSGTDFRDALEDAKGAGWRAVPQDGDWLHLCPDCQP